MKLNWERKRIGDFVQQSELSVILIPTESYTLLGMSLEGRGLFVREKKRGTEIGSKSLNKVVSGNFIYSRLFAWKGAFDFVTDNFEGCYVSNEYPSFVVDETKADVKFLHFYFNQSKVWKEVEQYCIGVTKASRNRFKEKFFLNFEINIPSLKEQQRIVLKIDNVKQRIEQIKKLRAEQSKDINNLLFSKYTELVEAAEWLTMKKVAPIHRRQVNVEPEKIYYEIGVRSFGKGLFEKPSFKGMELSWQQPYWMKEGDLLFSNIKAWEGAVGLIPTKYDGWVGSHRYITCMPNLELINPEFLFYYFRTQEGVEKLSLASPGTVDRNRTLNTKKLESINVPVPSIELQSEFVELLHKTIAIKGQHKETENELAELMPALLDKAFKGGL
jgi:type I restriction enzyme, S subunit